MIGELRPVEGQDSMVSSPPSIDKHDKADVQMQDVIDSSTVSTRTGSRTTRWHWERYFVYFLTLGVATALLFTIFPRVPEAVYGRLPVSKESRDYRGGSHSTQPSVLPPSSAVEPQQQKQAEGGQAPSAGGEEDTTKATATESSLEDQIPLYDAWGLPMLDEFEKTLNPEARRGKEEIAAFLAKNSLREDLSGAEESSELSAIARIISGGSAESLVGLTLLVKNVKPLQMLDKGKHVPRLLRITEVLGKGSSAIVVEAEDVDTHDTYAMRILRQDAQTAQWFQADESFIAEIQRELGFEEEGARQLCGIIPANMVASKKGIAVPLFSADLAGVPEAQRVGRYFILGRVQLMERLYGAVIDLYVEAGSVVKKAREYMARRLLQIVLKIQQAGLSHNDLKWDNMLLRSDGSFVISDLGSALSFGSPCRKLTLFTPQYREPQLALRPDPEAYDGGFTIPHASSDLWSLGILLYELFTGETYPYGEMNVKGVEDPDMALAAWLIDNGIRSSTLKPSLDAANIPTRWQELIMRLLEPNRRHRITSWEIMEEFPDLVRNPE